MRLAGGVGVPSDHPSAPEVVMVPLPPPEPEGHLSSAGWPSGSAPGDGADIPSSPAASYASTFDSVLTMDPGWDFVEVLTKRESRIVECSALVSDYPIRVWDELPTHAIVMPIQLASEDRLPSAVLILGLSSRLKFDQQYKVFTVR